MLKANETIQNQPNQMLLPGVSSEMCAKKIGEPDALGVGPSKMLDALRACTPAEGGVISHPRRYFAERIQVHVSTISRYTKKLAERGYIEIHKSKQFGMPNRYTLLGETQKSLPQAPEIAQTPLPVVFKKRIDPDTIPLEWRPGSQSDIENRPKITLADVRRAAEPEIRLVLQDPTSEIYQVSDRIRCYFENLKKCDLDDAENIEKTIRRDFFMRLAAIAKIRRQKHIELCIAAYHKSQKEREAANSRRG